MAEQQGDFFVFYVPDFYQLMGELALPPWTDDKGNVLGGDIDCAVLSAHIITRVEQTRRKDMAVIAKVDLNDLKEIVNE